MFPDSLVGWEEFSEICSNSMSVSLMVWSFHQLSFTNRQIQSTLSLLTIHFCCWRRGSNASWWSQVSVTLSLWFSFNYNIPFFWKDEDCFNLYAECNSVLVSVEMHTRKKKTIKSRFASTFCTKSLPNVINSASNTKREVCMNTICQKNAFNNPRSARC